MPRNLLKDSWKTVFRAVLGLGASCKAAGSPATAAGVLRATAPIAPSRPGRNVPSCPDRSSQDLMFALKLLMFVFPKVPTNKSITAQRRTYVLLGRERNPSEVSVPQETRNTQNFVWELKNIQVRMKRQTQSREVALGRALCDNPRSPLTWVWVGSFLVRATSF